MLLHRTAAASSGGSCVRRRHGLNGNLREHSGKEWPRYTQYLPREYSVRTRVYPLIDSLELKSNVKTHLFKAAFVNYM